MTRLGRLALPLLLLSCGRLDEARTVAALDEPYFRCRVQPILTKSCAMLACHGTGRRFFRVYARGRLRLGGDEAGRDRLLGADERAANFAAARVLVDPQAPDDSPLLRKPLEMKAGGYYHVGAVLYGNGNVYASQDEPDFRVLQSWVRGAKEDQACIEPGSDQ